MNTHMGTEQLADEKGRSPAKQIEGVPLTPEELSVVKNALNLSLRRDAADGTRYILYEEYRRRLRHLMNRAALLYAVAQTVVDRINATAKISWNILVPYESQAAALRDIRDRFRATQSTIKSVLALPVVHCMLPERSLIQHEDDLRNAENDMEHYKSRYMKD